jgi:hypothetical protein
MASGEVGGEQGRAEVHPIRAPELAARCKGAAQRAHGDEAEVGRHARVLLEPEEVSRLCQDAGRFETELCEEHEKLDEGERSSYKSFGDEGRGVI